MSKLFHRNSRERSGEMMKYILIFLSLVLLIVFAGILLVASHAQVDQSSAGKDSAQPVQQQTWEYPVAAGVWYPTDGPLPDKPMRYYRVRCWPGCHSGSTLGKYPDKTLEDKPIFPTSTIDLQSAASP
jgi:hypothetical protein